MRVRVASADLGMGAAGLVATILPTSSPRRKPAAKAGVHPSGTALVERWAPAFAGATGEGEVYRLVSLPLRAARDRGEAAPSWEGCDDGFDHPERGGAGGAGAVGAAGADGGGDDPERAAGADRPAD